MLLEEQAGGLLSVADRKLFFSVFELDERIATLPDSWAISTIMTRVREMKKIDSGEHGTFYTLEEGEAPPEDKPGEGSIAALQEWMRAADDDVLRRSRTIIGAECSRRHEAAKDRLSSWEEDK